ncbi:holo-ACP synthase [Acidipropionibacterium timonense]|uniref:holo-ACP synthase n=1 Tax=Acidipropionibacterium timonense TaxID=2161818 RepID=UPI00102F3CB1|nr:holo-ACP synthase [Acidipropionibacterium timonense]
MIIGVGVDLCQVSRWEEALRRRPGLAGRVLVGSELDLPPASQAARFAAKEALVKALGGPDGLRWREVEVIGEAGGAPRFRFRGVSAQTLDDRGVDRVHLSLSHDAGVAIAVVICEAT